MILISSKIGEFEGVLKLTYDEIDYIDRTGGYIERVITFKPHNGIIKFKDDTFNITEI